MMRIHTPASDSRHSASAAPSITGIVRNMRCSTTAARCSSSNSPGVRPHSWKSHERSSGRLAGSTPRGGHDGAQGLRVVGADPVEVDAEDEPTLCGHPACLLVAAAGLPHAVDHHVGHQHQDRRPAQRVGSGASRSASRSSASARGGTAGRSRRSRPAPGTPGWPTAASGGTSRGGTRRPTPRPAGWRPAARPGSRPRWPCRRPRRPPCPGSAVRPRSGRRARGSRARAWPWASGR